MKKFIKKLIRHTLMWPSIELAGLRPTNYNLSLMRRITGTQLSADQLESVSKAIRKQNKSNVLIFGLGNDSIFWHKLNRNGSTVFIENNNEWYNKVLKKDKNLEAYLVKYDTKRHDWQKLLTQEELLNMRFPSEIESRTWDVILVDAPSGWGDETPGRMKSIYTALQLVKKGGDIFVHDCNREVEAIYCDTFLKPENLVLEIKGPRGCGDLRHYHIKNK